MLDRETIIWEIEQALETLIDAPHTELLGGHFVLLKPIERAQIVLTLNHAIGAQDETH